MTMTTATANQKFVRDRIAARGWAVNTERLAEMSVRLGYKSWNAASTAAFLSGMSKNQITKYLLTGETS